MTGREKDLVIIRGLNHYPQDIEYSVEASHPALRAGSGAAFSVDAGGEEELVVAYEVQGKYVRDLEAETVLSAIREAVFSEHELQTHAITLLKPGGVPKTTSGKIQRSELKAAFLAGNLDAVATWRTPLVMADNRAENENGELAGNAKLSTGTVGTETIDSIRRWLTRWLAEMAGIDARAIPPNAKFADCGLDSLRACDLAGDLDQWLGVRIDPTIFWNFTTIDALAAQALG